MRLAAKRRTVPEAEGPRVPAADWLVLALVISQVFGYAKDPFLPVLFPLRWDLTGVICRQSDLPARAGLGYYLALYNELGPSSGDRRSEGSSNVCIRLSTYG